MDPDSNEADYNTQLERLVKALQDPSMQVGIDGLVSFLVSHLPAPYVESDSDSGASDDGGKLALALALAPGDGEDRISRLPVELLADIIQRLPTKDAGRTTALSTHWRRLWAGTPLLVDDAHLLGAGGTSGDPVMRALTRCVAAHPGPVRGVRITRVSFHTHEYVLKRLVEDLADKDVRDLILVNPRPWPLDMQLPDEILRCASLVRLYLGGWKFPKTIAAHRPVFPDLCELGLFFSSVDNEEFESLLAQCPKLEVLSFVMSSDRKPSRLHITSNSLKIAVEWMSDFEEIVVENAPSLERLLFLHGLKRRPVKIVCAPRLEVLGVLDLQLDMLEISGTVINAGMKVSGSNMVRSLKTLAVTLRFECSREAKMLSTLLKCFPCLETLHIMSTSSETPDGDNTHDLGFWEHQGPYECFESHLETVMLHGCFAITHWGGFIRYVLREGKALKAIAIVCSDEKASGYRDSVVGGSGQIVLCAATPRWSFKAAIDLSLDDPFGAVMA